MSNHPPARNTITIKRSEHNRNHPPAQNVKPIYNKHITPQPSTPILCAGSKHQSQTQPNTLKTYTPQPSTPIKHAGSKHKTGFPTYFTTSHLNHPLR